LAGFLVDTLSQSKLRPFLADVFKLVEEAKALPIPRISVESTCQYYRPANNPTRGDANKEKLRETHARTSTGPESPMKPTRKELELAEKLDTVEAQLEALEFIVLGMLVGLRGDESTQRGLTAASLLLNELIEARGVQRTDIHRQKVRDFFADVAFVVTLEDPPPSSELN